ncbi:hypothetical protein RhiirA5_417761 [Rhizophagus irregularis]|uniref:Uncharacterized protein n=1 Tax=Rhizophagus irregularis TaxID=588596 RepID=A0A2N0PLP6_9GLOM|nr:hypothetical protein RhiirA5_417761 [Rhizophagus irregularis]
MGFGMGWNMGFSQFHYIGGALEVNEELDQESLNIQNSDNESELFNYYLQELLELFQENIINMVATSVEVETAIRRTLENALELPANALNNALGEKLI